MSTLLLLAALTPTALAEGSDVLPGITLEAETVLGVDILDASVERIRWEGRGPVELTAPDGSARGPLVAGDTFTPDLDGTWRVRPTQDQLIDWDLDVIDPVSPGGRVFSENWQLNARFYDERGAWGGTLYVRALDAAVGLDSVVAVRMDGWAGHRWSFLANATGPIGAPTSGSVSTRDASAAPQHRIYLNPPTAAAHTAPTPVLNGASYERDASGTGGTFSIDAGTAGVAHIACDTDGDGVGDPAGGTDLAFAEEVAPGVTEIDWDGAGPDGLRLEGGLPECTVWLASGEVHMLAVDIETAWPGLQLHQADASGALSPLVMRWNDAAVAETAAASPDGVVGALASGADGVASGDPASPITAGDGSRSWGNFTETSRGNIAVLDTWAWLEADSLTLPPVPEDVEDDPEDTGPDEEPETEEEEPKEDTPVYDAGFYGGACSATAAPVGALGALGLAMVGLARRRRS